MWQRETQRERDGANRKQGGETDGDSERQRQRQQDLYRRGGKIKARQTAAGGCIVTLARHIVTGRGMWGYFWCCLVFVLFSLSMRWKSRAGSCYSVLDKLGQRMVWENNFFSPNTEMEMQFATWTWEPLKKRTQWPEVWLDTWPMKDLRPDSDSRFETCGQSSFNVFFVTLTLKLRYAVYFWCHCAKIPLQLFSIL